MLRLISSSILAVCSTTSATGSVESTDGTSGMGGSSNFSVSRSSDATTGGVVDESFEMGDIGASLNHTLNRNEESYS